MRRPNSGRESSLAAGVINGVGTFARFVGPSGVATDSAGNVYVADRDANNIRRVTPLGTATTFAGTGVLGAGDGPGNVATFRAPTGVAIDSADNLHVSDSANHEIRKITPAGVVSTYAGTGSAGFTNGAPSAAAFFSPFGLAVDSAGNVHVADTGNNRVRKITP